MNNADGRPELVCWKVGLKVRGPLLTTSSAPLGFGIDAPFARNAAGEYYLAGSLVKGRLKESWQELAAVEGVVEWNWVRWIGKEPPVPGSEDWDSERGLLQFADFTFEPAGSAALEADPENTITYRIQRDRMTHSVKAGQNLMIQSPFAAGGEYWFVGRVWGIASADEAVLIERRMRQGLCFTPAVGAETTVGFGVVTCVAVEREAEWTSGTGWERTNAARWGLVLTPEGPLCLAGRRLADNIFESEPEIAGGVIKGALATLIQRLYSGKQRDVSQLTPSGCEELCEEFSRLRILHAKAVRKGIRQRPCAVPLSAVRLASKEPPELRDAAFTVGSEPVDGYAPAFQIDWKGGKDAEEYFGITHPVWELRVRTQIETERRRAKDENLFAYRMLAARADAGKGAIDEYEWIGEIDFTGVAAGKRTRVQAQLARLLGLYGLPGVGKLKTRCVASRVDLTMRVEAVANKGVHTNQWVVTLQTPALLCDVAEIGAGLSDALEVYSRYWAWASGECMQLERMFAAQTLAGGGHLWKQVSRRAAYRPYVLTQPGSTFVLTGVHGGTQTPEQCLGRWSECGLPLAETVCKAFGLTGDERDWQRCPYVPQNGFGEIAVDQTWHWEKAI